MNRVEYEASEAGWVNTLQLQMDGWTRENLIAQGMYMGADDGNHDEHGQSAAGSIRAAAPGHGALPRDEQPNGVLGDGEQPERTGQPQVRDTDRRAQAGQIALPL